MLPCLVHHLMFTGIPGSQTWRQPRESVPDIQVLYWLLAYPFARQAVRWGSFIEIISVNYCIKKSASVLGVKSPQYLSFTPHFSNTIRTCKTLKKNEDLTLHKMFMDADAPSVWPFRNATLRCSNICILFKMQQESRATLACLYSTPGQFLHVITHICWLYALYTAITQPDVVKYLIQPPLW